jgi:hypothetical protein
MLATRQLSQLDQELRRIAAGGPSYYERLLDGHGADSFTALPPTRYEDLVRDQLDQPPQGSRRPAAAPPPVRAGWLRDEGRLLVLTWTAADLAQERACGVRILSALGVTAGMRVANTLPGALATPGSLLLGDILEDIGALDVPLGIVETEAQAKQAWDLVDRVEPQVLVVESDQARLFLEMAPDRPRRWWQGILWVRREHSPAPPSLPAKLGFDGWQNTCLSVPLARSFAAAQCDSGRFHFDASLLPERVSEGDGKSEILLTTLTGDTPLLRYRTRLCALREVDTCECGQMGAGYEVSR